VRVLAEVDAALGDAGEQLLEGGDLLRHGVAAVVDQDVDARHALRDRAQEAAVGLVADEDLDAVFLERLAVRVDVDAVDARLRTEVLAPQLQRAAVVDAELDDGHVGAAKARHVLVVDAEVVGPLLHQPALVLVEQALEVVRLEGCRGTRHGCVRSGDAAIVSHGHGHPVRTQM